MPLDRAEHMGPDLLPLFFELHASELVVGDSYIRNRDRLPGRVYDYGVDAFWYRDRPLAGEAAGHAAARRVQHVIGYRQRLLNRPMQGLGILGIGEAASGAFSELLQLPLGRLIALASISETTAEGFPLPSSLPSVMRITIFSPCAPPKSCSTCCRD